MDTSVFIDGASRGQGSLEPSRAACAVVIFQNRREVVSFARGLGNRTNNEAEYEALISALLICTMSDFRSPVIYSDSTVVVNHTNGTWQCKSPVLLPYYLTVREISSSYNFKIKEVPRSKVYMPDALCNLFLDNLEVEEKKML